jgi:uroporphyrin-III C-methyltransferase/precorrin-2 dehydrogenase/sirohydrochlorin ferrochelatase
MKAIAWPQVSFFVAAQIALKSGLIRISDGLEWTGKTARRKVRLPQVTQQALPAPARHCVSLVGAGPGCADLLTLRGAQRLQSADIIFYDRLIDTGILDLAPKQATRIYVGKSPGHHVWPQQKISKALVQAALQGKRVVRLKCGDPGVFARGAEEADALRTAGLAFEIIPGVTAASACAAHVGMFMTERGVVDTLVLTTATSEENKLSPDWTQYLHRGSRNAIYMGVNAAPRISDQISMFEFHTEIQVTIVSKFGDPDARSFNCRGSELAEIFVSNDIQNPAVIFLTLAKSSRKSEFDLHLDRQVQLA